MDHKATFALLAPGKLMESYRHDLKGGGRSGEETLCGLTPETHPRVDIACNCGHPQCELPVNCPLCLAILKGSKMN